MLNPVPENLQGISRTGYFIRWCDMRTIVIFDKKTNEVLACVPDNGDCFARKDVGIKAYNGTEPIFNVENGVCKLKKNAFLINL